MDANVLIAVIGIIIGIFQTVIILYLNGIRSDIKEIKNTDIKDIWKRMYSHTHVIKCNNGDCDARETGDVVIPHVTA